MALADIVIWGGAALALVGVSLLFRGIQLALRLRRAEAQDEDESRAALVRLSRLHMGALLVSVIGLGMIVAGGLL